ncbi:porin [Burkholderia sp. MSMB0856]|uniref:porin n=1 Tax=Burkholderia sp. MSMB0856 TaxID=1637869 RepID=UPI00075EDF4E|nr:porin [Burkholderia sp. MSMB0856]AOJ91019.1 porin [Burkholderia sp. MSMB0856]KVH31587.1 porin [Burkholderia sp. MSMB0856]
MKTWFRTMALCGCGAVSPTFAQSSVTLYGSLDAGITYTSDVASGPRGGRQLALQAGVARNDVWGLTGKEDLGGANFAVFRLESQFQTSDGALTVPGSAFSSQAYVGLGGDWGTVTLGRQFDFVGDLMPSFATGANTPAGLLAWGLPANASAGGALDNRVWGIQVNNAVKYVSPTFGGLSFGGLWGFGNVPGSVAHSSVQSAMLSYAQGAFSAALAYFGQRDVNAGGNLRNFSGGAGYNFGQFRVFGMVSDVRISTAAPLRATTYDAGLTYAVTPSLQLGSGFQYQQRGGDIGSANQITLSADYALSKRTGLYAVFARGHDSAYGAQVEAALSGPAAGSTQTAVRVGVRHQF